MLCFGPPEGAKVTFVHTGDWLGPQRAWEPQEALLEVARRYAAAYGPVTHREFREWFTSRSLTAAAARELFAEIDPPRPEPVEPRPSVRLLPEYDVYVMGFREREHLVRPRCARRSPRTARAATKAPRARRSSSSTASAPGSGAARRRRRESTCRSNRRGR